MLPDAIALTSAGVPPAPTPIAPASIAPVELLPASPPVVVPPHPSSIPALVDAALEPVRPPIVDAELLFDVAGPSRPSVPPVREPREVSKLGS
jgi:hypothetical protein